jgi:hypothetical protein
MRNCVCREMSMVSQRIPDKRKLLFSFRKHRRQGSSRTGVSPLQGFGICVWTIVLGLRVLRFTQAVTSRAFSPYTDG